MTPTQPRKPVVVLSHGAFHVSAHYAPLQAELERRGFAVISRDHPCCNGAVPANTRSQEDIDQLRSTILRQLEAGEDVVVAMHSMGGAVGTHATLGLSPGEIESQPSKPTGRILSLVYLAAFASKYEGLVEDPQEVHPVIWLSFDLPNGVVRLIPEYVNKYLYHDLAADQQEWALSHTVPFPIDRFQDFAVGTAPHVPAYTTIPTTYVISEEDKCVPTAGQEVMVARVKEELGVEFKQVRLKASHSAVISMPSTIADIIENSY